MNVDNHKSEDEKGRGGGEVWYEHKMSDGRVYYSHSQTRKTTWDRPQNAKIMPHPGQQSTFSVYFTHSLLFIIVFPPSPYPWWSYGVIWISARSFPWVSSAWHEHSFPISPHSGVV